MKKALLVLLYILFSLLAGCNRIPFQYEALNDEYDAARLEVTTEKTEASKARLEKAEKRLELYEDMVDDARDFYAEKEACDAVWFCVRHGPAAYDKKPKTEDELVKKYRHERNECQCVKSIRIIL